jgi:hypothetical protein
LFATWKSIKNVWQKIAQDGDYVCDISPIFSFLYQGCQIFCDTIYQNKGIYTKLPLTYQMAMKCTKCP